MEPKSGQSSRPSRPHSREYRKHLESEAWKGLCKLAKARANGLCERCHKYPVASVHHKHYETLGHESPHDVEALCEHCHPIADLERADRTKERIWESRLNGWASKVYGPNWMMLMNHEVVETSFRVWLARKGERE